MEHLVQLWIGIITAGVLLTFAWNANRVRKEKVAGTNRMFVVWGAVLLAVGALWIGGIGNFIDPNLASPLTLGGGTLAVSDDGTPTVTTIQQLPSGFCPGVEDTTVTLAAEDIFSGAATGGTHRFRVNGAPALTVSDAGTFTASPGDSISILWMDEASNSYYGFAETVVVPCSGTKTFSQSLYNNGTLTLQIFNEDGDSITGGTTETLAAGDVVTLDANIKGTFETGAPYGGIIYANYNASVYDKIILDFGGEKVSAPSSVLVSPISTAHAIVAYTIPAILSTDKILGLITIDVDDTINPDGLAATGANITIEFRPYNYFVNQDTGGSFDGPAVEDEDNVATQTNLASLIIGVA